MGDTDRFDSWLYLTRLATGAALVCGALWPTLASGQVETGNELQRFCEQESSAFSSGVCAGYIGGVLDLAAQKIDGNSIRICLPSGVDNGQIRDVVVAFLKAHPQKRHWPSSIIIINALNEAFCSK